MIIYEFIDLITCSEDTPVSTIRAFFDSREKVQAFLIDYYKYNWNELIPEDEKQGWTLEKYINSCEENVDYAIRERTLNPCIDNWKTTEYQFNY